MKHVQLIILVLFQILSIGPQMIAQTGASPIFFEASSPGEGEGIYIMDADGSNQRRQNIASGKGRAPTWSRDGCKILFWHEIRKPGEKSIQTGIYVMNADGSGQRPVIDNVNAYMEQDLRSYFAPDRSRIVFSSAEKGQSNIMVAGSDGSNIRKLTDGIWAFQPSWSPDGSKIAFQTLSQDDIILEVINSDGTNRTKIADHLLFEMSGGIAPSWAPDGSRITFSRMPSALKEMMSKGVEGVRFDIYTAKANGSDLTRLTTIGMAAHPVWSPAATCKENR